ncbi:TSUP family transporter [Vibrio penaeicida]|uniref:TSUP family transporter n=1 Tax=Vibrio penaeicida TaxID=104609 RepID=UPI000CEA273F|nr:TSUP family transporter [Vibrio penaeicida]
MELSLFSVSESVLIWLFCAALIAGIVDAIAGGGGLITVPSMMLAGIPPLVVLGTNRLQAVIGETTALITYWLNKEIKLKGFGFGILTTAIGAVLGSYSVSLFSKEVLQLLLPVLMVCITFYSILSKRIKNNVASEAKISNRRFMLICGLAIGFYNGFFGPGTGSIWMVAFVILLGVTIKQATIATKPLNLMGNLVSLLFFIGLGSVDYTLGLVMGAGQILGSVVGSKIVIHNGDKVVRPVFITVTLLMTVKLIVDSDHHMFVSETMALISKL